MEEKTELYKILRTRRERKRVKDLKKKKERKIE